MVENMGFILRDIKNLYNQDIFETCKKLTKLHQKLNQQKNRRIFLLKCKNEGISPKFLNFKTNHFTPADIQLGNKFHNVLMRFKNNTLNLLITDTTKNIQNLKKKSTSVIVN